MPRKQLIAVEQFCLHHNIEISFIDELQQIGLIRLTIEKKKGFIPANQVSELEKFVRLHYDLDINPEGMEAINHLLKRMNEMREKITLLQNRLRLYESGNE